MKDKKSLAISALVAIVAVIVALKAVVIWTTGKDMRITGELSNTSSIIERCRFRLDNKSDLGDVEGKICREYVGVMRYRGFVGHHYAAFGKGLEGSHYGEEIRAMIRHEYGLGSFVSAKITSLLGVSLDIASFGLIRVCEFAILIVFLYIFSKAGWIQKDLLIVTCGLLAACLLGINSNQFLLSPGFSVSRHFGMILFALVLMKFEGSRMLGASDRRVGTVMSIVALVIVGTYGRVVLAGSLLYSYITRRVWEAYKFKDEAGIAETKENRWRYRGIVVVSICCLVILWLLSSVIGTSVEIPGVSYGGSVAEVKIEKRLYVLLGIFLIYLWIARGSYILVRYNRGKERFVGAVTSPFVPLLLGNLLYPLLFWGSPNHWIFFLVGSVIPVSIITKGIIGETVGLGAWWRDGARYFSERLTTLLKKRNYRHIVGLTRRAELERQVYRNVRSIVGFGGLAVTALMTTYIVQKTWEYAIGSLKIDIHTQSVQRGEVEKEGFYATGLCRHEVVVSEYKFQSCEDLEEVKTAHYGENELLQDKGYYLSTNGIFGADRRGWIDGSGIGILTSKQEIGKDEWKDFVNTVMASLEMIYVRSEGEIEKKVSDEIERASERIEVDQDVVAQLISKGLIIDKRNIRYDAFLGLLAYQEWKKAGSKIRTSEYELYTKLVNHIIRKAFGRAAQTRV